MLNDMTVRIDVRIFQANTGGALNVSEEFVIEPTEFTEICKILGQFDDLAKRIRQEREKQK
jgi:hypothetical protein